MGVVRKLEPKKNFQRTKVNLKGKVENFPIKQTRAEVLAAELVKVPENFTVLTVCVNPKTNEYLYSTQVGTCSLSQLLGALELVKRDLIDTAREE